MKKGISTVLAVSIASSMIIAGCGNKAEEQKPANESVAESTDVSNETEAEPETEAYKGVAEINYANINYDFAEDIAAEKEALPLVPEAAAVSLSVEDAKGATGVILIPSVEEGNTTDLYFNAMVSGDELVFQSAENAITSAKSSVSGDLEVADGVVKVVPQTLMANDLKDEVITFTLEDGTSYDVHTLNECMPGFDITTMEVADENAGVYTFAVDKFLLRVSTSGELVYYRSMLSVGENMAEGICAQDTADGRYYTFFVELRPEYRNSNGGFSSGMYVVMDENYKEIDHVTQLPNTEANHTHGEGYLDQHEFVVLSDDHYLTLSYTPEFVENIPESTGSTSGYVWAGVFQEIKGDEVVWEISTVDYPMLYETAVEKFNYADSTDQGIEIENRQGEKVLSLGDGWQDYVHVNSLDYTLDGEGNLDKLLVSMRDQSAVYQFNIPTGDIDWILGGKASTLTGYEDYTSTRKDDMEKDEFQALTYAQHHARYMNKNADGTLTENAKISIFDNQTGMPPFLKAVPVPTVTRTFTATIDMAAGTAEIGDVITADEMDELTGAYHNASHCGSVQYQADTSVVIGWGLHAVVDGIPAQVPEGTITDIGFDDLRAGSRPIFTEYDQANGKVTFELKAIRNPHFHGHESLFSYRTYKAVN